MLFYILSRLGSICRGLACYSISYQDLAVAAEAWHAILYLIKTWQYPPRLGMLFYILSRLVSIRQRTNLQKPKLQKVKSKLKEQSRTAKAKAKLNKQRHARFV